jgi:ribosomal protein S18 acetylase RimI-like enzyme
MNKLNFIYLSSSNSNEIALIHKAAFPGFFLSKLGVSFLRVFYRSILENPNSVGIGIVKNNEIIGFAIGSTIANSFYKTIFKKNFLKLFGYILLPIIKNPLLIIRAFQSLLSKPQKIDALTNGAVLLSICVQPNFESKGIGRLLLEKFEEHIYNYNDLIILTTDKDNNEYVNRFYQKNNYSLHSTFLQGNRYMNLYYKKNIKNQ